LPERGKLSLVDAADGDAAWQRRGNERMRPAWSVLYVYAVEA